MSKEDSGRPSLRCDVDSLPLGLHEILTWVGHYFTLKPFRLDIDVLKMALNWLNEISSDPYFVSKQPETEEHRTAIRYVRKLPEGKILLWVGFFGILFSFFDFDVHVKKDQIGHKIKKAQQQRHSPRAWQSLANRFQLDHDFLCLKDQSDEFGKTAIDWIWHSKDLIQRLKPIEDLNPSPNQKSHEHFTCLNMIRDIFLEIRYDMLRTILDLIFDWCL